MTQLIFVLACIYSMICLVLYFIQEKLMFFPEVLPVDHVYYFPFPFEEINHEVSDGTQLNSVLMKSKESKGVILFLHGNGGAINGWGEGAGVYLENGYDIMYLDYRSYGKSSGRIHSEKQLISDAQAVYDYLKTHYSESKIVLSGTSMGTGMAIQLAAKNNPQKLMLNAPYYSLQQLVREKVPIVPSFIVKYKMDSYQYLPQINCPIYAFHGDKDEVIPHKHSLRLKDADERIDLTILQGHVHNDLTQSRIWEQKIKEILN